MNPHNSNDSYLQIFLLFAILIPAIFFLISQYDTLMTVRLGNRAMRPGLVWLQLIPVFGQIWQFFVVTNIADSIRREALSSQDDSVLGMSDPVGVEKLGKRPTLTIGILYCSFNITGIILNLFSLNREMIFFGGLLSLSGIISWIIYWVLLLQNKRKLKLLIN